jgi:hypothetical protein
MRATRTGFPFTRTFHWKDLALQMPVGEHDVRCPNVNRAGLFYQRIELIPEKCFTG